MLHNQCDAECSRTGTKRRLAHACSRRRIRLSLNGCSNKHNDSIRHWDFSRLIKANRISGIGFYSSQQQLLCMVLDGDDSDELEDRRAGLPISLGSSSAPLRRQWVKRRCPWREVVLGATPFSCSCHFIYTRQLVLSYQCGEIKLLAVLGASRTYHGWNSSYKHFRMSGARTFFRNDSLS